jgi:hypothetical protein
VGRKHPKGQNIRRDKTSGNEPPLWVTFLIYILGTFSLILMKKSIERGGEISQANDFATSARGKQITVQHALDRFNCLIVSSGSIESL